MKGHVCKVCGYIAINGSAPDNCPVCGAPKASFQKKDAINTPADPKNLTEGDKKHVPVITILRKCGLIPEGCVDAHVKMGQILHPMQPQHYINHIDFYLDKEFIARVHLTPEKLNPAAALHLKASSGKLAAIEFCTVHGAWINDVEL
ncbi:MAG: hypothetical protein ISS92_06035 [Candidatus Omnitrophica bacterium]|nr:hypothetical protein [Candidatus Omnitrophota bacterium]